MFRNKKIEIVTPYIYKGTKLMSKYDSLLYDQVF